MIQAGGLVVVNMKYEATKNYYFASKRNYLFYYSVDTVTIFGVNNFAVYQEFITAQLIFARANIYSPFFVFILAFLVKFLRKI